MAREPFWRTSRLGARRGAVPRYRAPGGPARRGAKDETDSEGEGPAPKPRTPKRHFTFNHERKDAKDTSERRPPPRARAPEPVAERKVELRPRHWRLNRPGEAANVVGRTEPSAPGYETRADAIASDDDFEEYKGEALDLAGFFQCIASPKGEYGLLSEVRAAEFV